MKNIIKAILFLSIGALIFSSCDKDDNNDKPDDNIGTTEDSFYPTTIGDYRIYQSYEDGEQTSQDSVVVEANGTVQGEDSWTEKVYVSEDSDGNYTASSDELEYFVKDGDLYASAAIASRFREIEVAGDIVTFPFSFDENGWFKISSNEVESWILIEDDGLVGQGFPFSGFDVEFTEPLTVEASTVLNQSVMSGGVNYEGCIVTTWSISTAVGTEIPFLGPVGFPIEFIIEYSYAEGVGHIKTNQPEFTFGIPALQSVTIPSQRSEVTDYNIAE